MYPNVPQILLKWDSPHGGLTDASFTSSEASFTSSEASFTSSETDQLAHNNPPPSPRRRESNSQLTHEDCLAILGLNWGATEREIKRAYYAKARELHPDRSLLPRDEATARFQILNEAQDQLRGIDRDEPQDEEA